MNREIYSLCFNGVDFTNFILFVKSMSSKDKSKGNKLALLHSENNTLVCRYADDSNNIIEYYVELYESDNPITEYFAVSVNDLAALIKCSSDDKFVIRKVLTQYEFNVVGNGWMPLKSSEYDLSRFTISGDEIEIGKVDSCKLKNAISSVLGYTQEYTYARDKYIQFKHDKMIVTSRQSSVVTSGEFPEMTLHRDDAAMLKLLLKDSTELKVVKVVSAIERLMFVGQKFKFATISTEIESSDVSYEVNSISNYITVDCDELYRLAIFSAEYQESKQLIGISVKNGEFRVSVKNVRSANHSSKINSSITGNVADTEKEAEIPTHGLLKALKLFQDKRCREVNIYFNNDILIIFDNETQAKIFISNR